MAKVHIAGQRGRPPDLTPPDLTPDSFNISIHGSHFVAGTDRLEVSKFYALNQLITEKFPTLRIIKTDGCGRVMHRRRYQLPSANADDLRRFVVSRPGEDLHFFAFALFKPPPDDPDLREIALRRTRVLISVALRDYTIERRFHTTTDARAIYFELGHHLAKQYPKTRTEARHIAASERLKRMRDAEENE